MAILDLELMDMGGLLSLLEQTGDLLAQKNADAILDTNAVTSQYGLTLTREDVVKLLNTRTDAQAEFVFWDHPLTIPADTDILSNATSIGLYPNVNDKPNINYDSIQSHFVVSDVIFNDPRTLFLGEAKKRGAQTINGLGMLVNQAALNFKIWTGVDAPMDVMKQTLMNEFGL